MDLHRFQNKWFTSLSDMRGFFPEDYQSQYMRPSEVEIYEIIFLYFLFVYDIFPRKICTLIYFISIVFDENLTTYSLQPFEVVSPK